MSEAISARAALGDRLMRAGCREEVVRYLAAADLKAVVRRQIYRAWCKATASQCRAEDLRRVAPGKPREISAPLFDDLGGWPKRERRPRAAAAAAPAKQE